MGKSKFTIAIMLYLGTIAAMFPISTYLLVQLAEKNTEASGMATVIVTKFVVFSALAILLMLVTLYKHAKIENKTISWIIKKI